MKQIKEYINYIYHLKYNLITCNCWYKSRRIISVARKLGYSAEMVFCVVSFRVKWLHNFPVIGIHFYSVIGGDKVDVAFDPETESKICKNEELKVLWGNRC